MFENTKNTIFVFSKNCCSLDLEPIWFLFLKTLFENTKNFILVFFKNCYCYLNSVFYMFFRVFQTKKKTKHVLRVFLVLLIF